MATNVVPYHESILRAIVRVSLSSLEDLAELIKETKIPAGHHDKVIATWKKRMSDSGWPENTYNVMVGLLAQKREAEEKAAANMRVVLEEVSHGEC